MTPFTLTTPYCRWNDALRLFSLCLLTLVLLLTTQSKALAQPLKVGVYPNKPLTYIDQNGEAQGLTVDVLKYTAEQEGWDLEFVSGSWSESLARLEQGEIDLQVAIAVSDARKKLYDFPEQTLITNWGRLYSHPNSSIESLLDLEGLHIAMLEKDIHSRVFLTLMDKFNQAFEPVYVSSYDDVLDAIEKNRVDAGVINRMYAMQNAHRFNVQTTPMIFNPIEVRYAAPKGSDPAILNALDRHIADLRADKNSIYYQSLEKWFGQEQALTLPAWLKSVLILSAAVIVLFLAFSVFLKKQVSLKTAEANRANTQLKQQLDKLEQAQTALKESEHKYRSVLDHQQDCLLLHKYIDGGYATFAEVNETAVHFYGYSHEELLGMTIEDLIAPESMEVHRAERCKERLLEDNEISIESIHIKKSGQQVPVEVSVSTVELSGETYILSSIRDVTERKKTEEERNMLEGQIRQKFKMEAVGALAGGIAHNFNNSLAIILGNIEMALRKADDADKVNSYLRNAQKAVLLTRSLIQQILTYSRKSSLEKVPVLLPEMVEDVLKLLRSTLPTSIDLKFQKPTGQCTTMILADPGQLHEILINLCANAVHAMDEKGTLEIKVEEVSLKKAALPTHETFQPGLYAKLSVSDTGCGMTAEILDKIFDPFFTTKQINEGTGMGLSTVQGIVKQHDGLITVNSSPGQGTCFEVYFPVIEHRGVTPEERDEREETTSASEKILLVDDEDMLLELGMDILTTLGYEVTTEISSKRALEIFKADPKRFDLVITDQTMPGLSGKELAQEISSLNPGIPIILCTGFSTQISEEDAGQYGISSYCEKPLKIDELSRSVKAAFRQKPKAP